MISFEWLMFMMIHNLYSNELQIISTVKKHILTGGVKRLPFTVPALVFSSLKVWLSWFSSTLLLILFHFEINFWLLELRVHSCFSNMRSVTAAASIQAFHNSC